MSNDSFEKLILILAGAVIGWLLSTLTTVFRDLITKSKEKRKLFVRLWASLEEIIFHLEIAPAWRAEGGLESTLEVLGIEEAWRRKIPPSPPELPEKFNELFEKISEWEAEKGENKISRKLDSLRSKIDLLNELYTGLSVQAKQGDEHISERGLSLYTNMLSKLRTDIEEILKNISSLRESKIQKINRKFIRKLKRK